ncbi:MAG: DUF2851 family protein [Bacteroidales bacterium]|nr:DUF2851 family protein [Bacteroidales bacterium]
MNEKILAFVWQNRLYDADSLITTRGESLEIVRTGYINTMSGPDISDAQVRIDGILWTGNVEFHVKSSHWDLHKHHLDRAYDNIILHVVWQDDKPLVDKYGNYVPTFVIKFKPLYLERYNDLVNQKDQVHCPAGIFEMSSFNSLGFTSRLTIERLEQKAGNIRKVLDFNRGDWVETFWQFLARTFGFGKNALPFELMAKSLPYTLIIKNSSSFTSVLALLFGQAGFLSDSRYKGSDRERLEQEYAFMQAKYGIEPIDYSIWKYSGIRPQNSPFLRMRQLASLVSGNIPLFSQILDSKSIDQLLQLFDFNTNQDIPPLGLDTKYLVIINLVCPFLVCYARYQDNYDYSEMAVDFLEKLPPEKNSLVSAKRKAGFCVDSAYYSQALIQLDSAYCTPRKCIDCQVGRYYITH